MTQLRAPFRRGSVALVLLAGTAAFVLMLYAIGQGWTGGEDRNGGAHAASPGLTGFAGLARLLGRSDHAVSLGRDPARFRETALLVLTPPHEASAEQIEAVLDARRELGPTLLVLPKWRAAPIPADAGVEAQPGWVFVTGAAPPPWFAELSLAQDTSLGVGPSASWHHFEATGALPDPANVQALMADSAGAFEPLVQDSEGDYLAAFYRGDGPDAWPLVIVFEPDLLNNFALDDWDRARLADDLVHAAMGKNELPVLFDLTLAGLGASRNLLSLAFAPPFLAATLCLLLAALVIAWRALARFGPPLLASPEPAQGKRQLIANGAALIARLRRWHLLAAPYAALVAARIAGRLGIHETEGAARERAIDRALARRDLAQGRFSDTARQLREARRPADILRAARALRHFERILSR